MIRVSILRFLMTVSPPPTWTLVAFAATVLLGVATLWLNPAAIDAVFGSILTLQMFAASNGFGVSAARGYFDPLLTGEHSRQRMAIGHLVAAALPGLLAWILLALVATAFGRWRIAIAPHRHLAIAIVSVFAWVGGLALPRMAAGSLWVFLLITAASFRAVLSKYLAMAHSPPTTALELCQSVIRFAVCPLLLLGDTPGANSSIIIGSESILLLIVIWFAVRYVERRDYGLLDPI